MSKRFLLINPWIADTAAYNFWIRPLGLYRLAEWLDERAAESVLIDCLSPASAPGRLDAQEMPLPDCFRAAGIRRRFRRYGIGQEEFVSRLKSAGRVDAVLVTSAMSYWYPGVQWAEETVQQYLPGVPVISGGVYPTLWSGHARRNSCADMVLEGSLDACGAHLSDILSIPESPVRSGRPWYMLGLHDKADFSAVRTAAGCPFRCAYCASRLVSGRFRPRESDEVLKELEALWSMGVRQVAFYDDALLVDFDRRLRPVLEALISSGIDMAFHTPNALHAGLIDLDVASLLHRAGFRTVRISLETVNVARQLASGGKVVCRDVKNAVRFLSEAGYRPDEAGVYLLAGLPGQSVQEVREGIEFVKGLGAKPYIAELSPIPGTGVWEELMENGMVRHDMDPLFTNNSLFCIWSGFCSHHELQELKMLCRQNPY